MKKKKYSLFKIVLFGLIFIYLIIFISASTGYYEYKNYRKTALTEEQIKKFELDIKNGVEIDMNNYLIKDDYSYKNKLSTLAIKISDKISNVVTSGVKSTFKFISKFIDE